MNADDGGRLRDLLANNRTLLAYIRTALAFAELGFAVAKFGLNPKTMHVSGYLGTFMVLYGSPCTSAPIAQDGQEKDRSGATSAVSREPRSARRTAARHVGS